MDWISVKFKLFCGHRYYPSGGYEDFTGYFDSIEDAKKYIKDEYTYDSCMWAHIVLVDKIVLCGRLDCIYDNAHWEWKEHE